MLCSTIEGDVTILKIVFNTFFAIVMTYYAKLFFLKIFIIISTKSSLVKFYTVVCVLINFL